MHIVTTYDPPPIPLRDSDWSAVDTDTYDGAEDSSNRFQIGWGETEMEAIADLLEKLDWLGGDAVTCPACGAQENALLGLLGNRFHFNCRACGINHSPDV